MGYVQSSAPTGAGECDALPAAPEDAPLSDELALVVAGAKRRAVRDGDRQVDSAHLLHSLLEADPDVRAAFPDPAQVARLLGYLVQRSIGYGLRWQGSVEDSGAVPLVRGGTPGWSPVAAAAMAAGVERAVRRGDERARGVDVLAALATDVESRAVEVLGRAGVDVDRLRRRLN
ncbi:Clp protease N-terminal domain-containing protein [Streptomyces sp. VRA16 Mangrove soil]|uniref:Clp protease N-terminal domain-containing protein n=1 Tax=Streptomyces sp. VRA16 Mangrove soil TaxID=2817434 RepID=UPI0035AB9753